MPTRQDKYGAWIKEINESENGFDQFSQGYHHFGFIVAANNDITYREWAPGVESAALIGDFSTHHYSISTRFILIPARTIADDWNRESHQMKKNAFGVFEITLGNVGGKTAIPHDSKVKISMIIPSTGERIERIPTWIKSVHFLSLSFSNRWLIPLFDRRVTQDLAVSPIYDAVFWNPPKKYQFKNKRPKQPKAIKVYEAHGSSLVALLPLSLLRRFVTVGISTPEQRIGTYKEFTRDLLPRIQKLGYNTIQLM